MDKADKPNDCTCFYVQCCFIGEGESSLYKLHHGMLYKQAIFRLIWGVKPLKLEPVSFDGG